MPTHKSGKLKQENKKHKLQGKTKASRNNPVAGRVETKRAQPKARVNHVSSKQDRINRQRQMMQEKRLANFRLRRQNISSVNRIVAVLPLHANVSIDAFKAALAETSSGDWTLVESETLPTMATFRCKSQKCNFQFLFDPSFESLMDPMWSMEIIGVSDSVLLLTDYDINDISPLLGEVGEKNLQLISAYGASNPVAVSINRGTGPRMNLKNVPKKWKYDVDHFVQQTEVIGVTKYLDINEHTLSNALSDNTKKSLRWRNQRSYMLSSNVLIEPQTETSQTAEDNSNTGPKYRVRIQGCLRGVPMYAHSLVHICGVGTGRITQIQQEAAVSSSAGGAETFTLEDQLISIDRSKQDDLLVEATPDSLLGEQTWPSEQELQEYDMEGANDKDDEDEMSADINNKTDNDEDDDDESKVEDIEDFVAGIKQLDADAMKQTNSQLQASRRLGGDKEVRFESLSSSFANRSKQQKPIEEEGDDDDDMDEDADDAGLFGEKVLLTGRRRNKGVDDEVPEDVVDDYVDTPDDKSARQRFARYRALQSFRSSHWHAKENLPEQYGRIFQFDDMNGMQRRLHHQLQALRKLQVDPFVQLAQEQKQDKKRHAMGGSRSRTNSSGSAMNEDDEDDDEDAMSMGGASAMSQNSSASTAIAALTLENEEDYVRSDQVITIELADVPAAVVATYQRQGYLVWYALHGYEYKCSVLHYNIRRVNPVVNRQTNTIAEEAIVKSKDLLLFHTGFRAFWARPVFSEAALNSEKAKFLRYLPRTVTTVGEGGPGTDGSALLDCATIERNAASNFVSASVIGPVNMTVTNAPVLVFKFDVEHQRWQLIANGAMSNVDPDRIILKKIILYGNPIRVRKRTAVVRHMFYDPVDVKWFQPAELTTLLGLRGHIKESVGTHGLFKAIFSAPISQNDQVNLVLYKRVYPKIPTIEDLPYGSTLASSRSGSGSESSAERNSLDKGWPLLFM